MRKSLWDRISPENEEKIKCKVSSYPFAYHGFVDKLKTLDTVYELSVKDYLSLSIAINQNTSHFAELQKIFPDEKI